MLLLLPSTGKTSTSFHCLYLLMSKAAMSKLKPWSNIQHMVLPFSIDLPHVVCIQWSILSKQALDCFIIWSVNIKWTLDKLAFHQKEAHPKKMLLVLTKHGRNRKKKIQDSKSMQNISEISFSSYESSNPLDCSRSPRSEVSNVSRMYLILSKITDWMGKWAMRFELHIKPICTKWEKKNPRT